MNGQPVAVNAAPTRQANYAAPFGGPDSFASFDFAGRVEISVTTTEPRERLAVLPHVKAIAFRPAAGRE